MGTVTNGVLTGGDVQAHWSYLGIAPANYPKVIIVPVNGGTNNPNPTDGATVENTIDVEIIGALCPTSNLTIILYIAPNTLENFTNLIDAASNPVTVNGVSYTPSVISCSWGASEIYFPPSLLTSINSQLATLASNGVVFTAASGDYGSSDGLSGENVDFPSATPHSIACGGTSLVCPNYTYDGQTVETVWSGSGGGISVKYSKPDYQSALTGNGRSTPDIALVADPNTGVVFTIGGTLGIVGGTSIVSPAVAAFVVVANVKKFITPLLYSYPSNNYHDITSGSNGAYTAQVGYDNCTGFGSISGINLLASLRSVPVTSVTIIPTARTLTVGATYTFVATVYPTNATNKSVTWGTSNGAIATVSSSGVVTAVSAGSATITVTTVSGSFTASTAVTVTTTIPVSSVFVTPSSLSVRAGYNAKLTATVLPTNATNKVVTWSSSNTQIATINTSTGTSIIVHGVSPGLTTVRATSGNVTRSVNVRVT